MKKGCFPWFLLSEVVSPGASKSNASQHLPRQFDVQDSTSPQSLENVGLARKADSEINDRLRQLLPETVKHHDSTEQDFRRVSGRKRLARTGINAR